jgi:tRNA(adenine34) deaminase
MMTDDEKWMDAALEIAEALSDTGNTPTAAIVVREGVEIGRGGNEVTTKRDPVLHAEIVAIRDACARTGEPTLLGATLYSSMEPCPMCAWALRCAGIERVVVGARFRDLDRKDIGRYAFDTFMVDTGQIVEFVPGVRRERAVALRLDWMARTGRIV